MNDTERMDWLEENFATVKFRPEPESDGAGLPWIVTGYHMHPSRGVTLREAINTAKKLTSNPK